MVWFSSSGLIPFGHTMDCRIIFQVLLNVSTLLFFISNCLGFDPVDNYLIDCGSQVNTSVGNRIFLADTLDSSSTLSTPQRIFVNSSSDSLSSTFGSILYQTARILNGTSRYTFSIKKPGRLWIRFHFFPFATQTLNLTAARFSISAENITLLKNFHPMNVPVTKEYSLNITSNSLVLSFTPSANSFAFLNALEVISVPDDLIPVVANATDPGGNSQDLRAKALETVVRVNMGNELVSPQNDSLWRLWESDFKYLNNSNLIKFISDIRAVNYSGGWPSQDIAPPAVYGTATKLHSIYDPSTNVNATWSFKVDSGFDYLIRFHFCDIIRPDLKIFNIYINSLFAYESFDLSDKTSRIFGAPYYVDIITRLVYSDNITVSISPSRLQYTYPDALLNGLEIMKLSNSKGSLDAADSEKQPSDSNSKKFWVILGSSIGASLIFVVLVLVLLLIWRNRRSAHVGHLAEDDDTRRNEDPKETISAKDTSLFSLSKRGFCFPLMLIKEATDNFSESLVVGVGGFGKVYKGVLRDNTKVAVKRGGSHSQQGLAEFRTEVEMLSQFRHRHLVSLIGYCDEKNEMIIIYEYMENGTLRNHLYGSDLPKLNWRKRLEICIGSARGIHYLHTGSDKAIIHRDVKSANILLDENFKAKVADFGLSKTGPEVDQTHVSTAVKGSFGYLDPEYLTRQQLTEKSDVYSLGVVMLEILSGRPVIDPSLPREMVNLIEWALAFSRKGELDKIADPHIVGEVKPESLNKFAETIEKCLAQCGADRPTMGEVLWSLECALQLQGIDERQRKMLPDVLENPSESIVSTTQYSMGSIDDLADMPMSKLFSQMVKADVYSR